jgi:Ca2+-binding RTX toxin-like protein
MVLHDAGGGIVALNDDNTTGPATFNSFIPYTAPADGVFYVEIRDQFGQLGDYGLAITPGGTGHLRLTPGDDVYNPSGPPLIIGDQGNDFITADAHALGGTDTVRSYINWTLAANVERLELQGSNNLDGTGNALNNTLVGNSGNNVLNGGAGNDTMVGGAGDDIYIVAAVGDSTIENAATVTYSLETIRSQFQANSYTLHDQLAPDVLGLSNGGYAVAYNNVSVYTGGYILVDFYHASGSSYGVTIPFEIDGSDFGSSTYAWGASSLTQLENGNIVLVWTDFSATGDGMRATIMSQNGELVRTEFAMGWGFFPQVAALEGGGFVVTYLLDYGLYAAVFDSGGIPITSEIHVYTIGSSSSTGWTSTTGLADGGFVVTSIDYLTVRARIFNADGTPRTDDFVAAEVAETGDNSPPAVAALPNGNWAVAYVDGSAGTDIMLAIFPPDGSAAESVTRVSILDRAHRESDPDITVLDNGYAAVNQNGFVSSYSSYGAALLVSGFGTPGEVVTTDRVGGAGYDATDFTSSFNGTSAAAPMVAGVVSLMYDANSALGWRDVQTILAYTARHVGSAIGGGIAGSERYAWQWNAANTWNGGALHFSNDYGYGLVDATAAILLAETWLDTNTAQRSSNEFTNSMDMLNVATVIPDGNATGTNFTGNVIFDDIVERVTVQITFSTTFTADMELYLTSPDGTVSELIDDVGGGADFNGTWTFETQAFRGERAQGTWTVRIVDDAGGDVLNVSDIVVRTFGGVGAGDRYVFTNEYGIFGGVAGHNTITDTNGGIDSLNASAVTSNSIINLAPGSVSTIAGRSLTIAVGTEIENAYGGLGNDTITGNALANRILGGRGNDLLNGLEGADTLIGGAGNDIYVVDNAGDVVDETFAGSSGIDTVRSFVNWTLGANVERLELQGVGNLNGTGNTLNNTLVGNSGNNLLNGGVGNDYMVGGAGDDNFIVQSLGDSTIENAGGGTDTVFAHINWTLGANIERLDLEGSATNGTGNSLNNTLVGNSLNNLLNGLGGNDYMRGGAGNDIFVVGEIGDITFEAAGEGTDTVRSSISWTLGANVERLELQGAGNLNGTGNTLNNTLVGNSGNNLLNGGAGNDYMVGGLGNDIFVAAAAGDSTIENAGGGTDTVRSYIDWTLGNISSGWNFKVRAISTAQAMR